jgi:hypothetical protein
MRKCPFCLVEIPEDAKVCKNCQSTVVKNCPKCAAEIVATAKKCRYCAADLEALALAAPVLNSDTPCGERRELVISILLMILTCGIWGMVIQYRMGKEINAHRGNDELSPGRDLLLSFLTCGAWVIYVMVIYPQAIQDMLKAEGKAGSDLVLPSLLLTIFGLQPIAVLLLQEELNKHWELHGGPRS